MKKRNIRPMHAMTLAWHATKSLEEHDFVDVSDKLRDQLVNAGMSDREAAKQAPVMLDGIDRALQGEFDFKAIRSELSAEQKSKDFPLRRYMDRFAMEVFCK